MFRRNRKPAAHPVDAVTMLASTTDTLLATTEAKLRMARATHATCVDPHCPCAK